MSTLLDADHVCYLAIIAFGGFYVISALVGFMADRRADKRRETAIIGSITHPTPQYDYHRTLEYNIMDYKSYAGMEGSFSRHILQRHIWTAVFTRKPWNAFSRLRRLNVFFIVIWCPVSVVGWFYDNEAHTASSSTTTDDFVKSLWVGVVAAAVCGITAAVVEAFFQHTAGHSERSQRAFIREIQTAQPERAVLFMSQWRINPWRLPFPVGVLLHLFSMILFVGAGVIYVLRTSSYTSDSQTWNYCTAWACAVAVNLLVLEPARLTFLYCTYAAEAPPPRNLLFDKAMKEYQAYVAKVSNPEVEQQQQQYSPNEPSASPEPTSSPYNYSPNNMINNRTITATMPSLNMLEMQENQRQRVQRQLGDLPSLMGTMPSIVADPTVESQCIGPLGGFPPLPLSDRRGPDDDIPMISALRSIQTMRQPHQSSMMRYVVPPSQQESQRYGRVLSPSEASGHRAHDLINSIQLQSREATDGSVEFVMDGNRNILPDRIRIQLVPCPYDSTLLEAKTLPRCFAPKDSVEDYTTVKDYVDNNVPPVPVPEEGGEYGEEVAGDYDADDNEYNYGDAEAVDESPGRTLPTGSPGEGNDLGETYRGHDPLGADHLGDVRSQIIAIYERHAPEKLADVDSILQRFAGEEGLLVRSLREKYGVQDGESNVGQNGYNAVSPSTQSTLPPLPTPNAGALQENNGGVR
eukprot:PhM_4_TR18733/c0_g1_i1/m.65786